MKHRPIPENGSIRKLNELKELKTKNDLKLNYHSNYNQIFSTITAEEQLTTQIPKQNRILISSNSLINQTAITSTTAKPTSGILFLETKKKAMAFCTAEEFKSTAKVLNNKNQPQTDNSNDFTTSRLLNVEINQTNTRSASPLVDASYLTKTTINTPTISTITTIPENKPSISERTLLNYSETNCLQLLTNNTPSDVELYHLINQDNSDNLTKILNLEDNFKDKNNINMIKQEQEQFDIMMDFEDDDINPKSAIPFHMPSSPILYNFFEELDQNLNSNIYSGYDKIDAINENDIFNFTTTTTVIPTISSSPSLVKDEELTTYDCINPKNVHAFSCDTNMSAPSTTNSIIDSQIDPKINEENLINFNNNNYNSSNNNNSNNNNSNNKNNFNFGDGNIMAYNNLTSCNNTYSKKKAKALKLKIDPQYNLNDQTIETPDVIKIVEALQQEKEKENLHPVSDVFSYETVCDDSNFSYDSFEYISHTASPEIHVGIQDIDSNIVFNEMSPCESDAISNYTTSFNNNNNSTSTPTKYESPLSVGGSSMNSYSDDAIASTSYLSSISPPPTPASQISQSYSEYSNTQYSENTQITRQSKKKRGRPALDHSSPPSLEQLNNADPNKRKYLEQRYKNNEASRISRRNRKRKEDDEKLEESIALERNKNLKFQHEKLTKRHEFLKEYLRSVLQSN